MQVFLSSLRLLWSFPRFPDPSQEMKEKKWDEEEKRRGKRGRKGRGRREGHGVSMICGRCLLGGVEEEMTPHC